MHGETMKYRNKSSTYSYILRTGSVLSGTFCIMQQIKVTSNWWRPKCVKVYPQISYTYPGCLGTWNLTFDSICLNEKHLKRNPAPRNLKRRTVFGTGCATVRPVAPNSPRKRTVQATTSIIRYTHWRVPPPAPWTYPWLPLYSDRCKDSLSRTGNVHYPHTGPNTQQDVNEEGDTERGKLY